MASLVEGARNLVTRGPGLGQRAESLAAAAAHARGRLDDALVEEVAEAASVVSGRLNLSSGHTVVALAGATGSGKSSTFNALSGLELSAVGVRRPTTSWATACVWGKDGAEELLDWLDIPPRHRVERDSMLDVQRQDEVLSGLVLLDLPDHDSTEVSHHVEVDRLVRLADLFVWVLDPQKYADAAIHDRYLRPLATHREVMLVALNQIDTVPGDRRDAMLTDLRRLLDQDGLEGVPLLPVSAREGLGLDELKSEIISRVRAKKSTQTRLTADLRSAAERLAEANGDARPPKVSDHRAAALDDALADAAGVPTVVAAVEQSTRMRAGRATGWPVVSWLSKLRPDPLKRLHLDLGADGRQLTGRARSSLPQATPVQRARVDSEVRALADEVGSRLATPWAQAVRRASVSRLPDLGDRLDAALSSTDLGARRIPVWAGLVRVLQWLLILSAVGGLVWLGLLFAATYFQLDVPDAPSWHGLPVPTLMVVAGVGLGILLALLCRVLVGLTARRRAAAADRRLRRAITEVSRELVLAPIEAELAAYELVRTNVAKALK